MNIPVYLIILNAVLIILMSHQTFSFARSYAARQTGPVYLNVAAPVEDRCMT